LVQVYGMTTGPASGLGVGTGDTDRDHDRDWTGMLTWEERARLEARWFPDIRERIWGRFRSELAAAVRPHARVLDAGSGPGSWFLRSVRGREAFLVGIDVVRPSRSILDAFVQGTLEALPFPDGTFDVVVCNDVIEHLLRPEESLAELARVLRQPGVDGREGGYLFVKTPSIRSPVTRMIHRLPFRLHQRLKSIIGVPEDRVFPTVFRCNTPEKLTHLLQAHGLQPCWLALVDETFGYLAINRPLYVLGLLYSRLMHTSLFHPWRNVMVGVFQRVR